MKTKQKPKYTMWQSIHYMLSVAWNHMRYVIVAVALSAVITVGLNLAQLFAAPSILGLLEQKETIGKLIISIVMFCGLLFVLTSAKAYVSQSCATGRVYVRVQIIKAIVKKSCTTSYPNRKDPAVVKLLGGAHAATAGNNVGCEHIWTTLTKLLTNVGGVAIYLVLLSNLNWFLATIVIATTIAGFFVSKHINEWESRHKEEKHQYFSRIKLIIIKKKRRRK